jgi:hypothetical protein
MTAVNFDVQRPPVFQRAHVFLRVALLVVIGWIGHPVGLLWLGLPVVAAILVSQKGGQRYLNTIPSLIVLAILTFVGAIVWVIAVIRVLVDETYPASMWRFLLGLVRWEACLLAYLASLVDRYPPFALERGSVSPAARAS